MEVIKLRAALNTLPTSFLISSKTVLVYRPSFEPGPPTLLSGKSSSVAPSSDSRSGKSGRGIAIRAYLIKTVSTVSST